MPVKPSPLQTLRDRTIQAQAAYSEAAKVAAYRSLFDAEQCDRELAKAAAVEAKTRSDCFGEFREMINRVATPLGKNLPDEPTPIRNLFRGKKTQVP